MKRRRLLQGAAALLAGPWLAHAQSRVPIADMHSHYGMVTRRALLESGLADDMRGNRVALVAWKAIPDGPWLAHSTGPAIEQALAIARQPLVWSHGWVEGEGGHWNDPYGFLKRRLSLDHARKIAAKGGVIGLWALGLKRPGKRPVGPGDQAAYARELASLVDQLGADHVAMGTDIEGVGPSWAVNSYEHVRGVIRALEEAKLPASVIERLAYANYARVLRAALKA